MIEATAHFTCYNDFETFKNCLESFLFSISYDKKKLEIIIVDNGSKNKDLINYIKNLNPKTGSYHYILNEKNDYPNCLKYSKIQARRKAKGKYFIDIPDDHLFFLSENWIRESINLIEKDETVGSICYCAQPSYRYSKKNNACIINSVNNNFIKSTLKGYADYHVMSKKTYELLGEYNYKLGRKSEGEYMERAVQKKFFRNIPKVPAAIDLDHIKDKKYKITKTVSSKDLIEYFKKNIFITNEDVIDYLIKESALESCL